MTEPRTWFELSFKPIRNESRASRTASQATRLAPTEGKSTLNTPERKFVTVPMSPELHAQLAAYAHRDDRTMVSVIRLAVTDLLARDEHERKLRMAS